MGRRKKLKPDETIEPCDDDRRSKEYAKNLKKSKWQIKDVAVLEDSDEPMTGKPSDEGYSDAKNLWLQRARPPWPPPPLDAAPGDDDELKGTG